MSLLAYKEIRKDFPLLQSKVYGKELVFLDSAASSQLPQRVIDAFYDYYRCRHANIHRGAYRLSYEATDLYEEARRRAARFLHAPEPESCIFTRNTTESLNLVAYSWGRAKLEEGDEILLGRLEHHSNLVPWMMLAKERGAKIVYMPLSSEGFYDVSALPELICAKTKIISVQHMSNVLGTIQDIASIAAQARRVGALFVVDGAQSAPHLKIDVTEIDCDFYAFSAHKMLGPTGVGVLYGKKKILEEMQPFMGGGGMILRVLDKSFEAAESPGKFEAGTPNIAGVVSFANALDYLEKIGLENIHEHEKALTKYAWEELKQIEGIELYGVDASLLKAKEDMYGGIISFNLTGVHPHDLASILDEEGIAIRAGHHCCEVWMRSQGISGTARVSFYLYNGDEDVDHLLKALRKVRSIFKLPHAN